MFEFIKDSIFYSEIFNMNTTAGCPHPNWVLCVTTFRLVILAWNRPHSLARLLDSVTATHWDWPTSPAWDIIIDFKVNFQSIYI